MAGGACLRPSSTRRGWGWSRPGGAVVARSDAGRGLHRDPVPPTGRVILLTVPCAPYPYVGTTLSCVSTDGCKDRGRWRM